MLLYLLAALFLLALGTLLVWAYRADRRAATLLTGAALIALGAFFTGFARTMIVYKPLMVLHIALTLYCWYAVILYLLRRKLELHALFSPAVSMLLFFLVAYYFKER
ncbi:hypothetical protein [Hydrogenimonas sp.]